MNKKSTSVTAPLFNVNDESVLVAKWLVAEGDRVEPGQVLLAIETSKAMVEIEAPEGGYVQRCAASGKEVPVGSVLCYLTASPGDTIDTLDTPPPSPTPSVNGRESSGVAGTSTVDASGQRLPERTRTAALSHSGAEARITPVARKIIEEHGIDIGRFKGAGIVRRQDVDALIESGARANVRGPVTGPTRFSARAKELLAQNALAESLFDNMGLVRASDVGAFLAGRTAATPTAPPEKHPPDSRSLQSAPGQDGLAADGVTYRTEELPRRKRMEARYLAAGAAHTLPSTVVVACPTRGLRAAAQAEPKILGNASAVILYEAARLLREHPLFNAYHSDGRAHIYDDVHVGFAVDSGGKLMVPVIRHADRKSIAQIALEMEEMIEKYLDDALGMESLSGGTFTVTDLSSESVTSFNPLINRGQSAILGIGAEFFPPGGSDGMFNLILAFDHQLSEGREAARFLSSLKTRLDGYERALTPKPDIPATPAPEPIYCGRCYRDIVELEDLSIRLVPTIRPDGGTQLLCTSCLNGF